MRLARCVEFACGRPHLHGPDNGQAEDDGDGGLPRTLLEDLAVAVEHLRSQIHACDEPSDGANERKRAAIAVTARYVKMVMAANQPSSNPAFANAAAAVSGSAMPTIRGMLRSKNGTQGSVRACEV
jgi:hypothetical protein